jgi:xylitol oxidase
VGKRYERFGEFVRLRERMDPEGKFGNGWLEEVVFGI